MPTGFALALSGCYVMQAATGQLGVMAGSRPIASVVADPATPEATRRQLELAVEAREFAVRELGLPEGGSYRKYADIGREYVLWNVVATLEFSLRPLRWCFPFAGCVNYRGYFREADADAYAWRLVAGGDDAVVEGVGAYSTLGHLADPLLSTMIGWRETRLVGTIFHELAHARLYVAGDSGFNEAFAGVVEDAGVRRWLESRGEVHEVEAFDASRRRHEEFLALLRETAPASRALPQRPAGRGEAPREEPRVRAPEVRVRAAQAGVGRLSRLRRLVRPAARQREPRVGRDLS